jgi:hypothetical protein
MRKAKRRFASKGNGWFCHERKIRRVPVFTHVPVFFLGLKAAHFPETKILNLYR